MIGDSGFYLLPDGKRVEVGYRLARAYWGSGLAAEVERRWIEVAREFVDAPVLHAFAHPENAALLHIIRKLGFTYSHPGEAVMAGWHRSMCCELVIDGKRVVRQPPWQGLALDMFCLPRLQSHRS